MACVNGQSPDVPKKLETPVNSTYFIYVKLPEAMGPLERGQRYEDPIQEKLEDLSLGEVSGGGSQLGDPQPDGTRPIEFCGIDIDVIDLERGLRLLREEMVRLGAPEGTELHYEIEGEPVQDELENGGWQLRRPRTFRHPGFGT